ncbi:MAG TPA: class I SAM-dependent methyltransferase [Stellaceae bacterium]|nr:class I SAM-dependent methyltransferase [Stellaceae bacterium]
MDRAEYQKMHAVEERMWWYHGLHANLLAHYRRQIGGGAAGRVLDAGCGTGGFMRRLSAALPTGEVVGMDFEPEACALAAVKSARPVCVGSINQVPFADASLAAIFSADVLCHRSVDEAAALAGFHRCLRPGGVLLLNLPAYDWMTSAHDRAVHTARRYTGRRVRALLSEAGFSDMRIGYWNTLLFPLMVLRRKLLARTGEQSDVMPFPAPIEWLCRGVMRIEAGLIAHGFLLPFGGSVLAAAVKHG